MRNFQAALCITPSPTTMFSPVSWVFCLFVFALEHVPTDLQEYKNLTEEAHPDLPSPFNLNKLKTSSVFASQSHMSPFCTVSVPLSVISVPPSSPVVLPLAVSKYEPKNRWMESYRCTWSHPGGCSNPGDTCRSSCQLYWNIHQQHKGQGCWHTHRYLPKDK